MKRKSIRNILVPIDFSELSIRAIRTARRLARSFGASSHLAHVRQFDYATFAAPTPPIVPFSFRPYEENGERSLLKELNALAREHAISPAICHVLGGGPAWDEVCRLAQKIPADLIAMPTHGRTGLKHVFLGSTAERIVQHSPCPVFVIREKKKQRPRTGSSLSIGTILVPVDFSDCSRVGVRYAIQFASEFGAKIILLHATYLGYVYSSEGTAIYDVRGLQEAARENAEHRMRQFVRTLKFGRTKFKTVITERSPALDICAFAKDHDVDLIITSTHGLTGLKHVLIGSVAEQVVRHATCSVMVVPSHQQVRTATLEKHTDQPRQKTAHKRALRPLQIPKRASRTHISPRNRK